MCFGMVGAVLTQPTLGRADPLIKIVATTGMIADAARIIGGEFVQVIALMGPGVDPHAYRQTRSDILAMTRADLMLCHGLYLEAQMDEFLDILSKQRRVVAVANQIPHAELLSHDQYKAQYDPHVWMDPQLWSQVVVAIQDALIGVMPSQEAQFRSITEKYLSEIAELHTYSTQVLSSVPAEARVLVTAHDAFNYFGRAYHYDVLGIQGISTQSEAGLTRVAELVSALVDHKIKAVFVESSVSERNTRALIEGAASRKHEVKIGGNLYSDAMGPDGTYEGTYLGMIDHNVTLISRALGGDAPARGLRGRLSVGTTG